MLIVRSPVRISFGGGGTDLPAYYEKYGGAILSTTINKYFYTILSARDDGKVQIISSDLQAVEHWDNLAQMNVHGRKLELPLAVLKTLGQHVSVNLFLASEIPPGTGLGSSATVCVNLLKALTTYLRQPASNYEIAERAFDIARNVLGKPVGKQDEYAAAFGGLNFITIARDGTTQVEPLPVPSHVKRELQQNLMLFFTGAAHDSWHILREQEKSSVQEAVGSLHEIRHLAERMRRTLLNGELNLFGKLLDQGWQAKKTLSNKISNSHIDDLYALAKNHGALGGKIAGAGGGGFLMLYCEQPQQAAVRQAFAEREIPELRFEFEADGAQAIVNDPFLDGDSHCGLRWSFVLSGAHMGNHGHKFKMESGAPAPWTRSPGTLS
jgi:D-glycero-alpha-D-manno-heptose-7-phosphate kinase